MSRVMRAALARLGAALFLDCPLEMNQEILIRGSQEIGTGTGPPLNLVVLGDSLAMSAGVQTREQTVGYLLAQALSEGMRKRVQLTVLARFGTTTRRLHRQTEKLKSLEAGLALVVVGGNDTLTIRPLSACSRSLGAELTTMRNMGWTVIVGTCPEMGRQPALRDWARHLAQRRSKRLSHLQTMAALGAGARTVALYDSQFLQHSDWLSDDRFHPSSRGYSIQLDRFLPAFLASVEGYTELPDVLTVRLEEAACLSVEVPGLHCVPTADARASIRLPRTLGTAMGKTLKSP